MSVLALLSIFKYRIKSISFGPCHLQLDKTFLISDENCEALLSWLKPLTDIDERKDDHTFGTLKVDFEGWFYKKVGKFSLIIKIRIFC